MEPFHISETFLDSWRMEMAKSDKRKAWEGRKKFKDRKLDTRELIDTFLIVCEGEKTEPNYFEKFPVRKEIKVEILGSWPKISNKRC